MNRCFFCQYHTTPHVRDLENLEKFISPRKKILSRDKVGTCAKHQRALTRAIKHARYLGLLPYVSYQGQK